LGTLYGGTGLQLQVYIDYVRKRWDTFVGTDFYFEVSVKITAGSYRIHNKIINTVNLGGDAEWTTTAANTYVEI